jgi:hypothetical protein
MGRQDYLLPQISSRSPWPARTLSLTAFGLSVVQVSAAASRSDAERTWTGLAAGTPPITAFQCVIELAWGGRRCPLLRGPTALPWSRPLSAPWQMPHTPALPMERRIRGDGIGLSSGVRGCAPWRRVSLSSQSWLRRPRSASHGSQGHIVLTILFSELVFSLKD